MARYPLFGIEQQGRSVHVSAQRRVNLYAEVKPQGDREKLVFHSRPGLAPFVNLGDTPVRGLYVMGDSLFAVHRGTLWEIDSAGGTTNRGTLDTSSGRVSLSDNGTQLAIVDGTEGYTYTIATTTFAKITDADFGGGDTVTFHAQYIITNVLSSGQFQISALADATAWDATDVATAESAPDDLVAVIVDHSELLLFGSDTLEAWTITEDTDFPYQRIQGAAVEWGLAARWSLQKFDNSLIYLASNRTGEVQVMRLRGYMPERVSTPELESLINAYAVVSDASGISFMAAGHPFYQLNFPTEGVSWLFDGLTGLWSEMEYGAAGARHRAEIGAKFGTSVVVSDYETGMIYKLDTSLYTDNGEPMAREITARHIFDEEYISISRLIVDMEGGVGTATGQGVNPQAMLTVSKDGGHSWAMERWSDIGPIGDYKQRIAWRRLGRGYDWTFRVRVSDPVKFTVAGAYVDAA